MLWYRCVSHIVSNSEKDSINIDSERILTSIQLLSTLIIQVVITMIIKGVSLLLFSFYLRYWLVYFGTAINFYLVQRREIIQKNGPKKLSHVYYMVKTENCLLCKLIQLLFNTFCLRWVIWNYSIFQVGTKETCMYNS